jgi:hypothetical protein
MHSNTTLRNSGTIARSHSTCPRFSGGSSNSCRTSCRSISTVRFRDPARPSPRSRTRAVVRKALLVIKSTSSRFQSSGFIFCAVVGVFKLGWTFCCSGSLGRVADHLVHRIFTRTALSAHGGRICLACVLACSSLCSTGNMHEKNKICACYPSCYAVYYYIGDADAIGDTALRTSTRTSSNCDDRAVAAVASARC